MASEENGNPRCFRKQPPSRALFAWDPSATQNGCRNKHVYSNFIKFLHVCMYDLYVYDYMGALLCMTMHYYYQRGFSLWANANGKFLNLPSQLHREHQSLQQFAVFLGGYAMLRGSFWESRRKKWTRPIYPFIHSFYPCALPSIHSLMQCWTFSRSSISSNHLIATFFPAWPGTTWYK